MTNVITRAVAMAHKTDPGEEILAQITSHLSGVHIGGCDLLIAMYVRPEKTASGIMLPDKTRDEERYQGKAGLVLQLAPLAFSKERGTERWFGDYKPKVGDWILINVNDSFPMVIGPYTCRLVEDKYVRCIIPRPDGVM